MSRSLSKDMLLAVKDENPKPIYRDIAALLNHLPSDGSLLEIEFLGTSHPMEPGQSFLREANAIAIPKQKLFQAFSVARHILQGHLALLITPVSPEVLAASSVVLLMDPEHLTAVNIRKRALVKALGSQSIPSSLSPLTQEKQWVDCLLTSRLNRHTKSPTLWAHRRWLVRQFLDRGLVLDFNAEITKIIMVSAERHPRNYYAWDHARWLYRALKRRDTMPEQVELAMDNVKQWCFRHHSDISGWAFLSFLLCDAEEGDAGPASRETILHDTLKIAESLRWTNESVWSFLGTAVAAGFASESIIASFMAVSERLSLTCEEDSDPKRVLQSARHWCEQYRRQTPE